MRISTAQGNLIAVVPPPTNIWFGATLPTLPTQFTTTSSPPAPANTNRGSYYTPGVGGDAGLTLQAAIHAAAQAPGSKGDVIKLLSGAANTQTTASQSFNLETRVGSGTIYIIANTAPEIGGIGLPPAGTRVAPSHIPAMASLRSSATNTGGNLITRSSGAGVSQYRLVGLDLQLTEANAQSGNVLFYVVLFNNLDTSTTTLANNITLDRCYIAGAPTSGCQHAVGDDGNFMEVTECYIERCHQIGIADVNCIVATNSTGPYRWHNNYLDSQGQGTFFGGSDTTLPSPSMPNDIAITNNYFFKNFFIAQGTVSLTNPTTLTITSPPTLGIINPGMAVLALSGFIPQNTQIIQQLTGTPGGVGTYQLQKSVTGTSSAPETMRGLPNGKNAVEFKVGQRVLFDSNYLENAGTDIMFGQPRTAFVLTCRNQSGGNPWYVLSDFTITNNVFTNCPEGGINILLQDGQPDSAFATQPGQRILFRNNLFMLSSNGNNTAPYSMCFVQSYANGGSLVFDHNTFIATTPGGQNSFLGMGGSTAMTLQNVVWSNNIFDQTQFGIINIGSPSNYASSVPPQVTQPTYINNVNVSGNGGPFPAGNFVAGSNAAVGYTNYGSTALAAGYALTFSSPYHAAGLSGLNQPFNGPGVADGTDIGCNIAALPTKSVAVPNKVVISGISGVTNNYVTSDGFTVTAYPTIAQAIAAQQPGDSIRLENGLNAPPSSPASPFVYGEQLNFKGATNGVNGNPITWYARSGHYLQLYKAFGFIATAYSAAGSAPPNGAWVNPGAGFWGQGLIHFEGNSFITVDMRDSTGQAQALQIADAVKDAWNPVGTLASPANAATYVNHHSLTIVSSHDCQVRGVHVQGANSYYASYGGWDCYNFLFDWCWWDKHGTNNFGNAQGQAWGEMFDWYGHDSLFQYCKATYTGHNTGPSINGFNNHAKYCDFYIDWSAYNTGAVRGYSANCGAGFLQGYVPQLPTPPPTGCTIGPILYEYCRFVGCSPGDVSAGTPYQQFFTANCIVRNCVYAGGVAGGHNITEMNVQNTSDTHTMLLVGQNSFYNNSSLNTPFISDNLDTGFTAPAHPNEYGGNLWQNNVYDGIVDNGLKRYLIYNAQATSQCGNNPYPRNNKGNQVFSNCINGTTATTDSSGQVISRTMQWWAFSGGAAHVTNCDWTDAGHGTTPGAATTFPGDMSGNIIQQPVWTKSSAALQGGPTTGLVLADLQAALNGMTLSTSASANSNMLGTGLPLVKTTASGTAVTQIPVTPAPRMFYDGRNCPFDTPDQIAIVPAAGGNANIVTLVKGTGVDVAGNHLNVQQAVTFGSGDKIYLVSAIGTPMTNWGVAPASQTLAFNSVFNFANFAGSPSSINFNGSTGGAVYSGGNIVLLPAGGHNDGQAWFTTPQNIQQFRTSFVFAFPTATGVPSSAGISFKIQQSFTLSLNQQGDANLCGIGWFTAVQQIPNQVAVKFDLSPAGNAGNATTWRAGGQPNSVGLYINGGPAGGLVPQDDLQTAGINFYSTHQFQCTLVYDGTLLTMTLQDLTTNAQVRKSWPVNIPAVLGGNTALVGFGAGQVATTNATLYSWNYSIGGGGSNTRMQIPILSPPGGLYASAQTVSITAPGTPVYYTTNGQAPTTSSTTYSGPIAINANTYLQAITAQSGFTDSLVAAANYVIGAGPTINFPSGFASSGSLVNLVGTSILSGANIQLCGLSQSDVGAAWYVAPVAVSGNWSCNFTFTFSSTAGGSQGMCFVIQNQPPPLSPPTSTTASWVSGGTATMANPNPGLGYSGSTGGQIAGILSSVAIRFDQFTGPSFTGLYTNGADVSVGGSSTSPVNLGLGHTYSVALSYNGTTLSMILTDVTASTVFNTSFTVNIPVVVGGNTAFVGFTASTGGGAQGAVAITKWTGF